MQATMDISPDILKWIASNADLTQAAADTLDVWINGTKKPTFNQIEQMSRNTGMPLAYFFLKDPPKENIALVEYRTIDSAELTKPSRDLVNTIHDMEEIQYWMREHLISEGYSPLDYVGKFSCSTAVIARRAYDNDYIDHDLYKKIMQRAMNIAKDKTSASGGDYYRTMASRIDRRFLSMLANSVQKGKTMYTDAFRLTNTNHTTFNKLLEQTGGSII